MAFERLKASLMKLRGRTSIETPSVSVASANIDRAEMDAIAQRAARVCSPMCRTFLISNMHARGVNSNGISEAINRGDAYYNSKRGVVRFRLTSSYNPYPSSSGKDGGGVWMVAAAQDAGRVVGLKAKAVSAKRKIKAKATSELVKTLSAGGVHVVPPKNFFEFTAGQNAAIRAKFRKVFADLVRRRRGNK